ncbi:hypothetical protein [Aquitalea magnusonii]|uniref:Lipoprotein n=1 Tax=Aquitalea magnusonii TaxID=332411 RepID=A0A318J4Z9_9NEIS|nr:hypothetical protein [Aquitalea magnusonii]PXX42894.1 hypothetical protein DFR38_1164 [Aquitalea magnusonii]
MISIEKLLRSTIIIATITSLSACAAMQGNQVSLTVKTEPPGAMLYEGNHALGMAPQTLNYNGDPSKNIINTSKVTAIWPSGAQNSQSFNLPMHQGSFSATISRPKNAPGLANDLANADRVAAAEDRKARNAMTCQSYADQAAASQQISQNTANKKTADVLLGALNQSLSQKSAYDKCMQQFEYN